MRTLVLVYGRFQGQTRGHERMIQTAHEIMSNLCDETNPNAAELMIVPTRTYNANNPFPFNAKLEMMRLAFPKYQHCVRDDQPSSIIDILKVNQEAFDNIILVCGQDRYEAFNTLLNAYNMIQYEYNSIEVVSCGDRNDDGNSIQKASGTKLRASVAERDLVYFDSIAPRDLTEDEVTALYNMMCGYISETLDHVS